MFGRNPALPPPPNVKGMSKEDIKAARDSHKKVVKNIKAQIRLKKAKENKSIKKKKMEEQKMKVFLENRIVKSLRPLSPDVVLALGFPSMKAVSSEHIQAGFQSQNIARSEFRIGTKGVRLLLAKMAESLEGVIVEKNVVAWAKPSGEGGNENGDASNDLFNPYSVQNEGGSYSQSKVGRLVAKRQHNFDDY